MKIAKVNYADQTLDVMVNNDMSVNLTNGQVVEKKQVPNGSRLHLAPFMP